MTPDEIVACVDLINFSGAHVRRYATDAEVWSSAWNQPEIERSVAVYARAAFHEAGRLLDFCVGSRVWCECGDQVTSPRWPNGDPVLCWVCTAEHKRRIAEAEAPKTCGTCADAKKAGRAPEWFHCTSDESYCARDYADLWPATHGCPEWRPKEDR